MAVEKTVRIPLNIENLLAIYMDGFASGVASILVDNNIPDAIADRAAVDLLRAAQSDPAVIETFREQIRERLAGEDSGPYTIQSKGTPAQGDSSE